MVKPSKNARQGKMSQQTHDKNQNKNVHPNSKSPQEIVQDSKEQKTPHYTTPQKRKIWITIFNYLEFEDMLTLRLVSRKYHEVVTMMTGSHHHHHHTSILWSRGRIVFPKKSEEKHLDLELDRTISDQSISQLAYLHFQEFQKSGLKFLHSIPTPNFHFRKVNLKAQGFSQFFMDNGIHIQELFLEHCTFSMVTFQHIVLTCKELKVLEIIGTFSSFSEAEGILPHRGTKWSDILTSLSVIKLRNVPKKPESWANIHCGQRCDLDVQNLSEAIVCDILSSKHLKHIEIHQFGFETVLRILRCLGKSDSTHGKSMILIFQNITSGVKPKELLVEITGLERIKIKTLKLGLHQHLHEVKQMVMNTATNNNIPQISSEDQSTLDKSITKLFIQHGSTLKEVSLANIPVSEQIFYSSEIQIPNLHKLKLQGTRISGFSEDTKKLLADVKSLKLNPGVMDCEFENAIEFQIQNQELHRQPSSFFGLRYSSFMDYIFIGATVLVVVYTLYFIISHFFF